MKTLVCLMLLSLPPPIAKADKVTLFPAGDQPLFCSTPSCSMGKTLREKSLPSELQPASIKATVEKDGFACPKSLKRVITRKSKKRVVEACENHQGHLDGAVVDFESDGKKNVVVRVELRADGSSVGPYMEWRTNGELVESGFNSPFNPGEVSRLKKLLRR